ncbi:MAG: carboxypeptidase regulatory-like domain-containing protein [Methanocella sp.]
MRPVLILIIILFIIALLPVSIAEQYGTIHGRALDKNGNGIAGVSLKLQNGDYKTIDSTTTDSDGSYSFDQVPVPNGNDIFRILASFDADGQNLQSGTAFFNVMALRITSQDVLYNSYPSSGIGCLYGVVTNDMNYILPVPATVYLDNGMFLQYAGGRYDTWSFEKLPQGKYVVWAETNVGNETYTSNRLNVTVVADDRGYTLLYLPTYSAGSNKIAYHNQPGQMKNVVHGAVLQKNGLPYAGAKVDLYQVSGSSQQYIASATANQTGQFVFDNVDVSTVSEKYLVRVTYEMYGASHTQDSELFTVYYANTLGVPHDINVPVGLDFLNSGSVTVQSVPSGAAIRIDGTDISQTTPYDVTGLLAGSHNIGLSLDGYYNDNFTVRVQTDSVTTVNRTLKVSTGSTYLNVVPGGALVYIDGEYAGTSPVSLSKFPAGQHSYIVACDGYRNESGIFEIVPGEAITKEIDMVATPGLSLAFIGYLISSFIHQIFSLF